MGINFIERKRLTALETKKRKAAVLAEEQEKRRMEQWAKKLKPFPSSETEDNNKCCKRKCLQGFIPRTVLERVRAAFITRPNQVERKKGIMGYLDATSATSFSIALGAFPICWRGLRFTTGVSSTLLQSVASTPKARSSPMPERPSRVGIVLNGQIYSKTDAAETWLIMMMESYCDVQPDESHVHLPFGRRQDVYDLYKSDPEREGPSLSRSKFYKMWMDRLPYLKTRAFHRFAVCAKCMDINDEINKAKTKQLKKHWRQTKRRHLNDVAVDRAAYHYRIERSIRYKESLSMVVDGADMSQYSIPYLCVNDKQSSEGWKIPTKLYGAILHGEFTAAYVYPAHLPGGSNVTIEVIHRTLTRYIEGDANAGIPKKKLPPVLYLQLDNTAKECKNRFIFTYLKSLIDCGVFKEIYLNFLPVGHTHCDIDQVFSRFSVYFKAHSAFDLHEFAMCLHKAYDDCKVVEILNKFTNFVDTVKGLLNNASTTEGADHFSEFRTFKFFGEERFVEGRWVTVGVMRCHLNFRGGGIGKWHDTHMRDRNIPLWKDENLLLNYQNFWSQNHLFSPYTVPMVPADSIKQYEHGLASSSPRIEGNRPRHLAEQIINNNKAIIELMKAEQTYQFRWNKVLYRNPPKARQQEEIIDPEELAKMEAICMDAARKRLQMEKCVRIERAKDAIEIGDFAIIRAAREVDEPFYVAQIVENHHETNEFTVHWYKPTQRSLERGLRYHEYTFDGELVEVRHRSQRGPVVRYHERTQKIDYNMVYFGFNRLASNDQDCHRMGPLPQEVLRVLRSLGLIEGTVRRK